MLEVNLAKVFGWIEKGAYQLRQFFNERAEARRYERRVRQWKSGGPKDS